MKPYNAKGLVPPKAVGWRNAAEQNFHNDKPFAETTLQEHRQQVRAGVCNANSKKSSRQSSEFVWEASAAEFAAAKAHSGLTCEASTNTDDLLEISVEKDLSQQSSCDKLCDKQAYDKFHDGAETSIDDGACQAQIEGVHVGTQWLASDADGFQALVTQCVKLLDDTLGYQDDPLSRGTLRSYATHLLEKGSNLEDIKRRCSQHNQKLDDLRIGDTVIKICGDFWRMQGGGGSTFCSQGTKIQVQAISKDCVVAARCPSSSKFGDVRLVNFSFDIENA